MILYGVKENDNTNKKEAVSQVLSCREEKPLISYCSRLEKKTNYGNPRPIKVCLSTSVVAVYQQKNGHRLKDFAVTKRVFIAPDRTRE